MFLLTVVTPHKKIVEGAEMEKVFVPGHKGELEILSGHAPLVTTLTAGVLKYQLKNGEQNQVAISWGYCQVQAQQVTIMAEVAEQAKEIDITTAKKEREEALQALAKVSYEEFPTQQQKFQWAEAKITATGKSAQH